MTQKKQEVKYNLDEFHTIRKDQSAIVCPIDHPHCSNKNAVHTSRVISVDGDNFETMNTKYYGIHLNTGE